jgi:hypothetical protein
MLQSCPIIRVLNLAKSKVRISSASGTLSAMDHG